MIPVFWWVLGYVLMAGILTLSLRITKNIDARKKVPLLGIVAALMLIGMSVPLGFVPYHINFAVLAGILLGPWLGFISAFVVNLFLALIGHGGITVVGLNTLTVGSEAISGFYFFSLLKKLTKSLPVAAFIATVLALSISLSLIIGIVALSQTNPVRIVQELREKTPARQLNVVAQKPFISLKKFIVIVVPLAIPGILIEATVMFLVVGFISRVRPDMLGSGR